MYIRDRGGHRHREQQETEGAGQEPAAQNAFGADGQMCIRDRCAGTVDVLEKGMRTENIQIIGVEMGGVDVCFAVIEMCIRDRSSSKRSEHKEQCPYS